MKKSRIINIALLLITISISLLLAEYAFRAMIFSKNKTFEFLQDPSIYVPPIKYEEDCFFEEDYWKLIYLFNRQINVANPHPIMGWTGNYYPQSLIHFKTDQLEGRRAVLLYGDSFAMCVDEVDCFENILNSDTIFKSSNYLLNYGVGGYGVDQIYLLFKESVDNYENPFVVFSLLTTDMDRSVLKVRDAQKPYFVHENNELKLHGVPITLSSKEFFDKNPPDIKSYLWRKFQNSPIYPFEKKEISGEDYAENILAINEHMLQKAFTKLKSLGNNYVVLVFHPVHLAAFNWRLVFLRNLLHQNNIPYLCDVDIRCFDSLEIKSDHSIYAIKEDGHPTTYLNKLISNELKQYILDTNYRKHVINRNAKWKENIPHWEVIGYEKNIRGSPEWLALVDSTAKQKNIPLDSMIYLSAKWMIQQDLINKN